MRVIVLDSNVLLNDTEALFAFPGDEVVISSVVIEEVDSKKYLPDSVGRNARATARQLDSLRSRGCLRSGIVLDHGGTLRVELNHQALARVGNYFPVVNNDNRLLAVALNLHLEEQNRGDCGRPVILVSQDAILRIKADALGLVSKPREATPSSAFTPPDASGFSELTISPDIIDRLFRDRFLSVSDYPAIGRFPHNHFVILRASDGSSQSALARFSSQGEHLELLRWVGEERVWGLSPRNVQQIMALNLLLDDKLPLVTITGCAGTGKTILALAAGLHKTQDEGRYEKLLVTRPVVPVGRDLGYLPGDKKEKLRPWVQPIYDNLEYLFSQPKCSSIEGILAGIKNIEIEALTYIRGRTIPKQYIIVDEAQNLTRHEVKTIVSRVGEQSKLVLLGDLDQIDHPILERHTNGLAHVVERFSGQPLYGHVTLIKGERSPLAQMAVDLL